MGRGLDIGVDMSMAKCKCDKIFDTDDELEFDEKGECCCDNCFMEMKEAFEKDLKNSWDKTSNHESCVEMLMDMGYRKVK